MNQKIASLLKDIRLELLGIEIGYLPEETKKSAEIITEQTLQQCLDTLKDLQR